MQKKSLNIQYTLRETSQRVKLKPNKTRSFTR